MPNVDQRFLPGVPGGPLLGEGIRFFFPESFSCHSPDMQGKLVVMICQLIMGKSNGTLEKEMFIGVFLFLRWVKLVCRSLLKSSC